MHFHYGFHSLFFSFSSSLYTHTCAAVFKWYASFYHFWNSIERKMIARNSLFLWSHFEAFTWGNAFFRVWVFSQPNRIKLKQNRAFFAVNFRMAVDLYYFIIIRNCCCFVLVNQIFHLIGVANRSIDTYGSGIEFYYMAHLISRAVAYCALSPLPSHHYNSNYHYLICLSGIDSGHTYTHARIHTRTHT